MTDLQFAEFRTLTQATHAKLDALISALAPGAAVMEVIEPCSCLAQTKPEGTKADYKEFRADSGCPICAGKGHKPKS